MPKTYEKLCSWQTFECLPFAFMCMSLFPKGVFSLAISSLI